MTPPLINSEFDVGTALRLKREQAGLSQRQLAEQAELTHVTIANVYQKNGVILVVDKVLMPN